MKMRDAITKNLLPVVGVVSLLSFVSHASALPISLGSAGPGSWAVLETGNHASNANVSIANASSAGYVTGNIGFDSTGGISDSGTPITGSLYAAGSASINGNVAANVSGSIFQDAASQSLLNQARTDAANAAAAAAALSGSAIANITTTTTLFGGGVYFLNAINLNNETLTLSGSASASYVFNVSDAITLSHASILLSGGLTENNVLFNITRVGGTGLGMSGGLATESILHGIVLANNSQVNETPGLVVGEIISGDNISIASGAQVKGVPCAVPDIASTSWLMLLSFGTLATARRLRLRRC